MDSQFQRSKGKNESLDRRHINRQRRVQDVCTQKQIQGSDTKERQEEKKEQKAHLGVVPLTETTLCLWVPIWPCSPASMALPPVKQEEALFFSSV